MAVKLFQDFLYKKKLFLISAFICFLFASNSFASFIEELELIKSASDSSDEIELNWPKVCDYDGVRITYHISRNDFLLENAKLLLVDIMGGKELSLFDFTSCKLKDNKIHNKASQVLPSGVSLIKDYNHVIAAKKEGQKFRYYVSDESGEINEIIPPSNY